MARKETDHNSEPETLWTKLFGRESRRTKQSNDTHYEAATEDGDTIRQYLLRLLGDEEQRKLEERLLTEDALFEELEIAEDVLIDRFLSGELSRTERDSFEKHFLAAPERQRNLRFAEAVRRNLKEVPAVAPSPRPRGWWNLHPYLLRAAAGVAAVTILAGIFSVFLSPPTFATLTLTLSNGDRSEGVEAAKAKRNVDELRIVLLLPERLPPAAGYRAVLTRENGENSTLNITKQDSQSVSVVIPISQLPTGQYAIQLFAIGADGIEQRIRGSYLFNVE